MPVLNFAAHILDYQTGSSGSIDSDGDHVQGKPTWVEDYARCDIVPAGQANTRVFLDGQVESYSYTIYNLPRNCRKFKYGDVIRIRFFGKKKEAQVFKVLGFHRYQLQCKIWV